jgi:hypothetical protein
MNASDPQFIYMMMLLPSLFGLTLVGEGINKLVHEEQSGLISLICGLVFILGVVIAYIFFQIYLKPAV